MADRLLKVNAYTTLDLVDAEARGHDFTEEGFSVANVTTDDDGRVLLQLELDNMTEQNLPAHVDELSLDPDQARTLAAALEKSAEKAADGGGE
ncbi:DUF6360 family protein [Haloarchaeobius sp. TZWSO28]|uniref:DUF6360 family protein n=1 Tax=Haloarchaeobius sp. TZWSO28 TaxID=3446119 RepID=UPI003EBAF77D